MFVVLMSFALAASPAGGPPDGERGSGRPHGPPPPLPALVLHAAEDADLDAAQLDRLRALAGDARPGLEALHAEVEAAHQALGDLLSGEPPDTRALVAAGRSLTAAEGALRDGEMRLLGQMAVELGPDGWAAVTPAIRTRLLVALAVALGGTLFGSHLVAWRRVGATADLVAAAQGGALVRAFLATHTPDGPRGAAPPDLAPFLERNAPFGLRYAALVRPDGAPLDEVGPRPHLPPDALRRVDAGVPVHDAGLRIALGPPPPFDPGGPRLLVAFEPLLAADLRAAATRNLALSGVAALAVVVTALLLARSLRDADRARAETERQRRLASLGEMSAVLAHEIRNPLASLKGHAQLLEEEVPAAYGPRVLRVVTEARRLERLVDDLLTFARTGRVERRPVDPGALVSAAVAEVGVGEVDLTAAPPTWSLDPVKVQAAVANVVRNAEQVSDRVEVRVSVDGDTLVVAVRDHGPGLPEGAVERIFEPFFTTRSQGTGLGLAVARRVVEEHGGRVEARSHPDGGAEITLRVPR